MQNLKTRTSDVSGWGGGASMEVDIGPHVSEDGGWWELSRVL